MVVVERLLLIPMLGMSQIFSVWSVVVVVMVRLIYRKSICHPEHHRRSGVSGGAPGEQANPAAALA